MPGVFTELLQRFNYEVHNTEFSSGRMPAQHIEGDRKSLVFYM